MAVMDILRFLLLTCMASISTQQSELAKVYHTNVKGTATQFKCSSTPKQLTYSPYLMVSNVIGVTTDCVFQADSFFITLWTEDKPYTGILKVSMQLIVAMAIGEPTSTPQQLCENLFDIAVMVQISSEKEKEYDVTIRSQTVFLDGESSNCVGYYQFYSRSGKFRVTKKGIPPSDVKPGKEMVLANDNYIISNFEYYELKFCSSEFKPMRLNHKQWVQNPIAVLDGNYPSGTECYYQVEPLDDDCHTVLHFQQNPFELKEECETWAIEATFMHKNGSQVTERFDCSKIVDNAHVNPPWIIHHPSPLIRLRFGKPTGISVGSSLSSRANREFYRLDRFELSADCLHTETISDDQLICSSECDNKVGEASLYIKPCWGRSSRECVSCQYAIDESQCVSQCPADKFRNSYGVCEACNAACLGDQSCLSPFASGCYRLCHKETPFRTNYVPGKRNIYMGYLPADPFSIKDCATRCDKGLAAMFYVNGTRFDMDEKYSTPTAALTNDLMNHMDITCTDKCPEGFKFADCVKDGPYQDMEWCCPVEEEGFATWELVLLFVLMPAAVGAFLVLGVVMIIYCWKKHKKTIQRKEQALKDFYVGEGKSNIRGIANRGQLLIVEPEAIELKQVIGQGAFGCVYSALWRPPNENIEIPVAVKQLKNDPKAANQNTELLDEAKLMASVNHDNLVRLIAISMNDPMMLITKFMTHGGSLQFIVRHKDIMTSYQFMEWARQLAAGMEHLESLGMIHRDLAARNVLVEDPKRIRISDFGLSKLLDADKDEVDYQADDSKLPIRWLAKECLVGRLFSHKSDVWAYGVTLWEFFVYGLEKPYGKVDLQTVKDLVIRGRRLVQPQTCSLELYTQMLKCWMTVPDSRPSFTYLENWFAESRECASKYFFTKYRDNPLEQPAKLQSNIVNLSSTSNNSNEFATRGTAEADMKPRERVSSGGARGGVGVPNRAGAVGPVASGRRAQEQHQGDNSIPRRDESGSDEEYLVPQKPPSRPPPPSQLPSSPPHDTSHFRQVEEDEYLRPVPMPRNANPAAPVPPHTSSVENDNSLGGIRDFSIETRENELQKYFPGMDVRNFDKAHNMMEKDYDSSEPASNYKDINSENGLRNSSEDLEKNGADNMDRKEKVRISQRWKGKQKPRLAHQDSVTPQGDYTDVNTRQPYTGAQGSRQPPPQAPSGGAGNSGTGQKIATADSMRRNLPAESSV